MESESVIRVRRGFSIALGTGLHKPLEIIQTGSQARIYRRGHGGCGEKIIGCGEL